MIDKLSLAKAVFVVAPLLADTGCAAVISQRKDIVAGNVEEALGDSPDCNSLRFGVTKELQGGYGSEVGIERDLMCQNPDRIAGFNIGADVEATNYDDPWSMENSFIFRPTFGVTLGPFDRISFRTRLGLGGRWATVKYKNHPSENEQGIFFDSTGSTELRFDIDQGFGLYAGFEGGYIIPNVGTEPVIEEDKDYVETDPFTPMHTGIHIQGRAGLTIGF